MIRVEWWKGRTPQQKSELSKKITDAFTQIAGVPSQEVQIIYQDVDKRNWAIGGKMCAPISFGGQ